MSFFKKIAKIVEPKTDNRYEYGCAMLYFDFPEMKTLHGLIQPHELYAPETGGYGLENEPHITLLFGLHSDEISDDAVLDACGVRPYSNITLSNVSLFKNPDFDVLKFDVDGEDLHYVNNILTKLPHTNNFPGYHPHATIGYLKPGAGDEVLKRIKMGKPYSVTPKSIVYSKPDKTKKIINL
jgi:2'-5' RNA ligase